MINNDKIFSCESFIMNESFQNALLIGNVSNDDVFTTSNLIYFPKRLVEYNKVQNQGKGYVWVENSWVYIFNINYKLFLKKIRNICNSKNIQNLFDIKYNSFDYNMYKRGRISKDRIRIELIRFKEFFSIEVINLLQMVINSKRASFKNVYKTIITEITEKTYIKETINIQEYITPLSIECKTELKNNPLLQYQQEFVEKYDYLKRKLHLRGILLSFDQGLGKTLTSLALSLHLNVDQVIIICPNSVKNTTWSDEIVTKFDSYVKDPQKALEDIYVYNDPTRVYNKAKDPKYIITNNESISKILGLINKNKKTLIIVDECQNYRYVDTKRCTDIMTLINSIKGELDVLPMSGTPIKGSPNELTPTIMMIDKMFDLKTAQIFNKSFNINNNLASEIVKNRFNSIIYRRTKETEKETLQLPEKHFLEEEMIVSYPDRYTLRTCFGEIEELQNKYYEELYDSLGDIPKRFEWFVNRYCDKRIPKETIEKYIRYIRTKIIKRKTDTTVNEYTVEEFVMFCENYVEPNIKNPKELKEFVYYKKCYVRITARSRGLAIGQILPKRRAEMFIDMINNNEEKIYNIILSAEKKTALFSACKPVIKRLEEFCDKYKIKYVTITGDNPKERPALIKQFQEDEKTEVLIGTNSTMGVGITITCANTEIIFGQPWRGADLNQLSDRIHRIGQDAECFIYTTHYTSEDKNLSDRYNDIINWSNTMTKSYVEDITNVDIDEG